MFNGGGIHLVFACRTDAGNLDFIVGQPIADKVFGGSDILAPKMVRVSDFNAVVIYPYTDGFRRFAGNDQIVVAGLF